jgi:hypothetical protein
VGERSAAQRLGANEGGREEEERDPGVATRMAGRLRGRKIVMSVRPSARSGTRHSRYECLAAREFRPARDRT